jgi:hypothetical protein
MKPEIFFDMLLQTVTLTDDESLSYMVSVLESDFGITIKKQSLHERFNERSVLFVKAVLSEILCEHFADLYSGELLPCFSRILIKDSTKFMVSSSLEGEYKSCGGDLYSRSKAGVSIQYEYDLKSGGITDLNITSGSRNDRTDAGESVDNIDAGDLIIRDLGYFSTPVFQKCIEKKAFFLSRLDCSVKVYDENLSQLSFSGIYRSMQKTGMTEKEMNVYVGKNAQMPARLILQIVPHKVYEQRIREKTKKSRGQGRGQLTEETKIRCMFNLFITNADVKKLSVSHVFPLYRIRWQIELQFKSWKSVFKIDHYKEVKKHRYLTMLYIKLLLIVVNLQVIYCLQASAMQTEADKIIVISLNKALKTMRTLFDAIFDMIRGTCRKAMQTAWYIRNRLSKNHRLESKKNKLCLPEILQSIICISEK